MLFVRSPEDLELRRRYEANVLDRLVELSGRYAGRRSRRGGHEKGKAKAQAEVKAQEGTPKIRRGKAAKDDGGALKLF